jgi:hypothetical protein
LITGPLYRFNPAHRFAGYYQDRSRTKLGCPLIRRGICPCPIPLLLWLRPDTHHWYQNQAAKGTRRVLRSPVAFAAELAASQERGKNCEHYQAIGSPAWPPPRLQSQGCPHCITPGERLSELIGRWSPLLSATAAAPRAGAHMYGAARRAPRYIRSGPNRKYDGMASQRPASMIRRRHHDWAGSTLYFPRLRPSADCSYLRSLADDHSRGRDRAERRISRAGRSLSCHAV